MAGLKAPPSLGLRVRRSVGDLSDLDLSRLRRAFSTAMQIADDRGYMYWAGIYGAPAPAYAQLGTPTFLAWNRAYLLGFERALQSFEPGVALPWWDWEAARNDQEQIPRAYTESTVDGEPNPLYEVELGAEIQAQEGDFPVRTSRDPGSISTLPGKEDVAWVLKAGDFETFAIQLEQLHNHVHTWVGGTNGKVSLAAYDPFFWAYQASIDRLWWLWQKENHDQGPPEAISASPLAPFSTQVEEVWDPALVDYEYAESTPRYLAGAADDSPAVADRLNFNDYAQAFAEIIASEDTAAPLTIGIYGSWGIGKSSLLKMIAKQLPKPKRRAPRWRRWLTGEAPKAAVKSSSEGGPGTVDVYVVNFNAWDYSSAEKIWPALVRQIMERMEKEARWSFGARFFNTVRRNLRYLWHAHRNKLVVTFAALPIAAFLAWRFDLSTGVVVTVLVAAGLPGMVKLGEAVRNPVSRWVGSLVEQDGYGDELPYMREIRDDLKFLTEQLQGKPEGRDEAKSAAWSRQAPRILVMIDDLDRCEPDKAVEVLRAINRLLDFKVFIVCLGIDARVITAAVEAHYEQLLGRAGASGYEYLDKIVQIPFRIPTANPQEVTKFLSAQMPVRRILDLGRPQAGESEISSGDTYGSGPAKPGGGAVEEKGERPSIDFTEFSQAEVQAFEELAPFIRHNPRHIKRLVNVYRLVRTLAVRRGVKEILGNIKMTITWIVICAQWPYTVGVMLRELDAIAAPAEAGGEFPTTQPLPELYRRVRRDLNPEHQQRIDDDVEDLGKLLNNTKLTWGELRKVQPYTLNFNPAIEEALHSGRASHSGQSHRAEFTAPKRQRIGSAR